MVFTSCKVAREMVDIPEYFKLKAARQFGQAGPGWVQELPSTLSQCLKRWNLLDCQPIDDLSINLVCFAKSPVYGDVVLKIEGPHSERFTEMAALELYAGRYACQCLECDRERGVLLLERIMPGNDLRSVAAKDEQLAIGTEILCKLPIPLRDSHGFPSYRDWLTNTFSTMQRQYQPDDLMKKLMSTAWELFVEVDDSEKFLLHGDLHHENILQAGNGEWKIIDPQGVVGSAVFECGRFIENHVINDNGIDQEEAFHAISYMADRMSQPKRRIAAAFFILHLLSICWGYEMNYTHQQLAQGVLECAELVKMIETFPDCIQPHR